MNKENWINGIPEEVDFWNQWLETKGLYWKQDYVDRLNPELELQEELGQFFEKMKGAPRILDIGAGPLTYIGKVFHGMKIDLVPVDALAEQYDVILQNNGVEPLIRTIKWDSENIINLPEEFGDFDLIVARNTLDHSYDPMLAIVMLPYKLNDKGVVYLRHFINEATRGNFNGLHQWNFCYDDGFKIKSKTDVIDVEKVMKEQWGDRIKTEVILNDGNELIYIIKYERRN